MSKERVEGLEPQEKINDFLNQAPVHYVECADDPTALIAVNPAYFQDGTLRWWDTTREKIKKVETSSISADSTVLMFTDPRQSTYSMTPMTLEIYMAQIKHQLPVGMQRDFSDEAELFEALLGSLR